MAAANKQYTATFAIGARFLGSFRGVMAMAENRLHRLRSAASKVSTSFLSIMKPLAGVLALFAGFAGASVFHSVFEGAQEEAIAAEQRARKLSILLLQHNEIRQRGLAFGQRQASLIFESNEALARQTVLHKDVLDTASASLSVYGYSPKRIAAMMGPLSDVLVAMRGVSAGEEEAAGLADAWGRAVKTGMTKPLKAYGFVLSDVQQKEFKGLKNAEARNAMILKWAQGFKGVNAEAAKTDVGKIARFHNQIKEFAQDIGKEVLPAQAAMAVAWSKALPSLQPLVAGSIKYLVNGITSLAGVVQTRLVPAWHTFQRFLAGPLGDSLTKLRASFSYMVSRVGPAFANMFGVVTNHAKSFQESVGDILISGIDKLAGLLRFVGNNASWLIPLLTTLTAGLYALSVAIGVVNALVLLNPWTWVVIGIVALIAALVALHQKFGTLGNFLTWLKDKFVVGWNKSWSEVAEKLTSAWEAIKEAVSIAKTFIVDELKALGEGVKNFFLAPLESVKELWNWLINAPAPQIPAAAQNMPATSAAPNQAMYSPFARFATGGVLRRHSIVQVAERGPEAIIPLNRSPRAQRLLNYASQAIGKGPVTNNRESNITFAPQITIHGNADERVVSRTVRDAGKEFLASFRAAQKQERRLSYESGYA